MEIKNNYIRLLLYGIICSLLIIAYSTYIKLNVNIENVSLKIINSFVTYLFISIFGVLFLNKIDFQVANSFIRRLDYYGLYYLLYFGVILLLVGVTEVVILANKGFGFYDISYIGLSRLMITIYVVVFSFLYIRFRKSLTHFKWF